MKSPGLRHLLTVITLLSMSSIGWSQPPAGQRPDPARSRPAREGDLRGGKAPEVGQPAPAFKLHSIDGDETFELKSFAGKKPVALVFGSYT